MSIILLLTAGALAVGVVATSYSTNAVVETEREISPPPPSAPVRIGEAMGGFFAQFTFRMFLGILARLVGLTGLMIVYQSVEAEGMREMFGDIVSTRLHRTFLLGFMGGYEETRRLDLANAFSAMLMIFTYFSWEVVIARVIRYCDGDSFGERVVVLIPAVILMVFDTVLFGVGVYVNGSLKSPIPAIMLALAFDAMLVLFSYAVLKIRGKKT